MEKSIEASLDFQMIFIVGAPRSGTTWLQAMLASHPEIVTGQETHFFEAINEFLKFFNVRKYPRKVGLFAYWSKEKVPSLLASYFFKFIEPLVKDFSINCPRYFLEKTPEHTLFIPLISQCFPNAKFIHIIRDGRHVVASLLRAAKREAQKKRLVSMSATTASLVWKKFVDEARKSRQFLGASRYFELKYEDLRKDTFNILREIFSWLSLSADKDMLKKIIDSCSLEKSRQTKRFKSIKVANNDNYSEPEWFIGSASTSRKNFDLSKLELYKVYDICGDLLKELGYIPEIPYIPLWARILSSYKIRTFLRMKQV